MKPSEEKQHAKAHNRTKKRRMRKATLQDYKERMLRVLVHIQQNLDRELSLEELAGLAYFSPYHFHRIFRGMVGETLQGHIRRIRLERAARRLKTGSRTIIEIAFEAGYETHEAFTRAFGAMTGLAPSEFRARWRVDPVNHAASGIRDRSMEAAALAVSGVHYNPEGSLGNFQPFESGGSTMDVEIKHMEPQRVAFMRHAGAYDQCGKVWDAFVSLLGAKGWLGPGATFIGVCHDDPEVTPTDKVRYDACVTVDEGFQPEGEIGVQTVPGGEYAVTTHQGPYSKLGETYARICGQWIPRSGRVLRSAPCFEVYLNDPESTEPEELLTDIHVPLEPAQGANG